MTEPAARPLRVAGRRVGKASAAARAQAFADARDAFSASCRIWHIDGSDPCRTRVLADIVETLDAWATGKGSPDGPVRAWHRPDPPMPDGRLSEATVPFTPHDDPPYAGSDDRG